MSILATEAKNVKSEKSKKVLQGRPVSWVDYEKTDGGTDM